MRKVIPPDDPRAGWLPRRTAMVALAAAVGGCVSNRYLRDAPQPTSPPPSAPDAERPPAGPPAPPTSRVYAQVPPSVGRAIEHVLKQPSDHAKAAVLDFAAHSATPRFHLIDRVSGDVLHSFRVAHGHGSEGKREDGYAEVFSNEHGSNASSLGLYQTGETYRGVHPGLSMRMDGLSPTNSNARSRFIVIHEASYMDPESWKGKKAGRPGRSDGCFVFSKADRDAVISQLQGGALIYAIYEKA